MKFILSLLLSFCLMTQSVCAQKVLLYSVAFKIKNLGTTINGSFKQGDLTIQYNPDKPKEAVFEGSVETKSIHTGIKLRDNHLRDKSEFFAITKFPKASMKAVKVETMDGGNLRITWALTMKGITKNVSSIVNVSSEGDKRKFKTEIKINRNDWTIGGSSITMGDTVTILLAATTEK